jgi:hypothetical protein
MRGEGGGAGQLLRMICFQGSTTDETGFALDASTLSGVVIWPGGPPKLGYRERAWFNRDRRHVLGYRERAGSVGDDRFVYHLSFDHRQATCASSASN